MYLFCYPKETRTRVTKKKKETRTKVHRYAMRFIIPYALQKKKNSHIPKILNEI